MPILMNVDIWLVVCLTFLAGGVVSWRTHLWWRSFRAKNRSRSGYESEKLARKRLESRGIEILSSPFELESKIRVDGVWTSSPVRVDFLVLMEGKEALVEVKSTERSANPHFPDTRRQLREYRASSPYPLYLLDIPADTLLAIDFEESRGGISASSRGRLRWISGFGIGLFVGLALMQLWWIWQSGS